MSLSCYVPPQIIPKSRVVHLADKQILKRHIQSYPKITVSKTHGGGAIPGPWTTALLHLVRLQLFHVGVAETLHLVRLQLFHVGDANTLHLVRLQLFHVGDANTFHLVRLQLFYVGDANTLHLVRLQLFHVGDAKTELRYRELDCLRRWPQDGNGVGCRTC